MNQTEGELLLEMFEDLYARRDELREAIEALEGLGNVAKQRRALYADLNSINKALGEPEEAHDALIEQWERDIAEGRTPDLNAI